jgi:hypothetical protein
MFQAALEQRNSPNNDIWVGPLFINRWDGNKKIYAVGSVDLQGEKISRNFTGPIVK